jgi:hypothetical protein
MRRRRLLLAARALSCGTLILACKSAQNPENNLPGNPKGSWYDDAGVGARGGASTTEGAGGGTTDGGVLVPQPQPSVTPPPANPKGSWYDDGGYLREDKAKEKT